MLVTTVSWSLIGASGLRHGVNCPSAPCPSGVQRAWSQPIGTNTKPSRRTALAGVWASAVIAGTIASSSGSARVACIPFRNIRRGNAFLVMIMSNSSSETVRSSQSLE